MPPEIRINLAAIHMLPETPPGDLAPQEAERAMRISNDARRRAFLAGRHLLRTTLPGCLPQVGRASGTDRPEILPPDGRLFSLSHSGKRVVCAAVDQGPAIDREGLRVTGLGVDIEQARPRPRLFASPEQFFHPLEVAWLREQTEAEFANSFYFLWTVKEAIGKGTGSGTTGFRTFSVVSREASQPPEKSSAQVWNFRHWRLPGGWNLAVAWEGPAACDIRIYRRSGDGLFNNSLKIKHLRTTDGSVSLPILYC